MKLLIRIVAFVFFILTFVILNYLTIPFLDTLDKNSFNDAALGILIILAHIFVPVGFLFFGIFKGLIDEGKL